MFDNNKIITVIIININIQSFVSTLINQDFSNNYYEV